MSRGHDGTNVKHLPPKTMQGIVIGGVANGVLLQTLDIDAQTIELGRPTHAKPLESKHQVDIEFAKETSRYFVNVMYFPGVHGRTIPFGLAIVEGKTASWAMTQLIKGFVLQSVEELKQENIKI